MAVKKKLVVKMSAAGKRVSPEQEQFTDKQVRWVEDHKSSRFSADG